MHRPVPRRRGIQSEVLVSLAVVMLTANALLAAFFFETHSAQTERLRGPLGRALIAEARAPVFPREPAIEASWWTVSPDGGVRARSLGAGPIDPASFALAAEARAAEGGLLKTGAPWQPFRFAVRLDAGGEVAVARLPAAVPRSGLLGLLLADVGIFALFGGYLMRRRVAAPLSRLAAAARQLAEGEPGIRVQEEGVGEVAELGWAFNEMSAALERRTGALEKAVAELRQANASLRRARAGLDRAERLAAVGRLAAGVAHEVGNPMGALLAFLDLAGRDEGLGDDGRRHLERAAREGERVRVILRQLLDFSRPPRAARSAVDLAALAEQVVELVSAQRRYDGVAIRVERADGVPSVHADPGLVVQIVLNLAINAADAVCGGPEPRVELRIRPAVMRARSGESEEAARSRRRPDAVECEVADNGPGVPEDDRERIFDPFFTHKPPGEGTGLGLANALRLAEELGGALEYAGASDLGGASFRLRLPVEESGDEGVRASEHRRGGAPELSPADRTP